MMSTSSLRTRLESAQQRVGVIRIARRKAQIKQTHCHWIGDDNLDDKGRSAGPPSSPLGMPELALRHNLSCC